MSLPAFLDTLITEHVQALMSLPPEALSEPAESDYPSYAARHGHLRRERGRASYHHCVDCGGDAQDWSQIHGTTGLEPTDYEPRCRKCHAVYDTELRSVLTRARVRAIRASVGATRAELAKLHGVSQSTIQSVLDHKTWKAIV
jgi:hypothetical protein